MPKTKRDAADAYAKGNLASLAADVLLWRRHGSVPSDSLFHNLANQCAAYVSESDPYCYQEAERIVIHLALELAATHHEMQWTAGQRNEPVPVTTTGYASLLPKLLDLSTVDDMSDEQYSEWINSLPEEEFFAFMAVSHTNESFSSAVAEAKRRLGVEHAQTTNRDH